MVIHWSSVVIWLSYLLALIFFFVLELCHIPSRHQLTPMTPASTNLFDVERALRRSGWKYFSASVSEMIAAVAWSKTPGLTSTNYSGSNIIVVQLAKKKSCSQIDFGTACQRTEQIQFWELKPGLPVRVHRLQRRVSDPKWWYLWLMICSLYFYPPKNVLHHHMKILKAVIS